MNPFDVTKDLSFEKKGLIDDSNENEYIPFLVNKHFSYFSDTVFYANEVNEYHNLPLKMQHDFYLNGIRKAKRYAKWHKKEKCEHIQIIRQYYGYSYEKAKEAYKILSKDQLVRIMRKLNYSDEYQYPKD